MIDDIHEPVDRYRTEFRDAHARHTSEYFEALVRKSGVDEAANAKTVAELRVIEQQMAGVSSSMTWWKVLRGAVILAGLACLFMTWNQNQPAWLIGPVVALALVLAKLNPLIKENDERLQLLTSQRDLKLEEAWQQMAPLNRLYDWQMVALLVKQTVPRLELDPYFSDARFNELRDVFGWTDPPNPSSSVSFAHSGVLNGNPFVVARTLNHWMGTKTYENSIEISWTEQERDHNGRWQTVTRRQTLHASVTEPFPEYAGRTIVIYGNEAAPNLSFSRSPSNLSKLEGGMINDWRIGRAVKQLESKSRDLDHGGGFTVMANREFDALFAATDRDHEVQFRLLFTPLAQQEMLKLLRDKTDGYGDDFGFTKRGMVNFVMPDHMAATDISGDPAKFHAYELAVARKIFNDYHNDLFRSLFFGMAPILTIPLYQQHRSHADIYADTSGRRACYWEHETIANYFGERRFQDPECITRSILKTTSGTQADGSHAVRVTALGYRGHDRVTKVSVWGGDGRYHDVPVYWVEYEGVRRDTHLVTREIEPGVDDEQNGTEVARWHSHFQGLGADPSNIVLRRSIIAAILPARD